MIQMKRVPSFDIDAVWPDMIKYLENINELSRGLLTPDTVLDAIRERDMQALVAVDEDGEIIGVAITEIMIALSGLRVLNIVALAGDRFDEWKDEGDRVLRLWARDADTPMIHMVGRKGWTKKLASLGWTESAVMMSLDLRN